MSESFETEQPQDHLTDLVNTNKRRRDLLPLWIKIFCWFFMLFGVAAFACLLLGALGYKPSLAFYGFETNEVFSISGMIVIIVGVLKGITAFALWTEKVYAIKLAKIDSYIGIVLCVISMLMLPIFTHMISINIRLELVLIIPFLMKLNKIQFDWEYYQ